MAEETPAVEPVEGATPETTDEPLGEPGKKALIAEREARAAEKARADELAARLQELQDRDKSEEQKRQEERDRLAQEVADLTSAKTRAEVSAATSVPLDVLAGPKSASVDDLNAYATLLTAWRGDAPKGPVLPNQGKTPEHVADSKVTAFAEALGI